MVFMSSVFRIESTSLCIVFLLLLRACRIVDYHSKKCKVFHTGAEFELELRLRFLESAAE